MLFVFIVIHFIEYGNVPRLPSAILSMGLMLAAFMSIASGLILDTVTRGRREVKLLAYLEAARARRRLESAALKDSHRRTEELSAR